MRIIAGSARGRRLVAPSGTATRPTSDRAREALFSALTSALGSWQGCTVLDLYAGSGALGLEAASRGAEHVVLVDSARAAVQAVRTNIAATGLAAEVHQVEAAAFAASTALVFDVVVADPPYAVEDADVAAVLSTLRARERLAPEALVVVERASRSAGWVWPEGFEGLRERAYGEAMLWYGRAT